MSISNTVSFQSRGISFKVGSPLQELDGLMDIQQLGGGQATEQDVTTLRSTAVEVQIGLTDGGQVGVSGIAPLHAASFKDVLQDANINGKSLAVQVTIGGVPTGESVTDGSASEAADISSTGYGAISGTAPVALNDPAPAQVPAGWAKFTDAGMPGIIVGDFLRSGTKDFKIVKTDMRGTDSYLGLQSVAATPGTLAASNTGGSFKLMRPSVRYTFTAFVPQIGIDLRTNDVIRYNATFRVTGKVTTTVGTPAHS